MNVPSRGPCTVRRIVAASILALLLPGVTCTSSAAETHSASASHRGPQLTITGKVHDFGRIPQGETLQHEFTLSNTGDEALQITEVKPSCGCTTTGDWPHTLRPGESGPLPIKVETAHFVGPIVKTLSILSNDPANPEQVLEMRAKIWTPVSILNPVLIFPAITDPAQSATRSTTVRSEVDARLALSNLRSDNPHFRPELKEIVPGKEYEVVVTTVPPLPEGTQTGRITMASSNAHMPEIAIQAVVTVLPAVQVAPTQFAFGVTKLAQPEKRYAVVLNNRGADLKITGLETDAPGVTLQTSASPDGKQFTITLTFPAGFALKPGDKYFLHGKTNQPSLPSFDIPILYSGER